MPLIQKDDVGLFVLTDDDCWVSRPLLPSKLNPGDEVRAFALKDIVTQVEATGVKEAWLRCGMPSIGAVASRRSLEYFTGLAEDSVQEAQALLDRGVQPATVPSGLHTMLPIERVRAARVRADEQSSNVA